MIAVLMPCLFLCNTCARAELRKQERARKLCSATLSVKPFSEELWRALIEKQGYQFWHKNGVKMAL